jgi:CheY-like chemotaxis protein
LPGESIDGGIVDGVDAGSVAARAAAGDAAGASVSSRLRVQVEDTGIGIPEDKLPGLFEAFEQADGSITRNYGGSGLGLAICKKIVTLMNGSIWASSEVGKGSTFTFEVEVHWGEPLTDLSAGSWHVNPNNGSEGSSHSILLEDQVLASSNHLPDWKDKTLLLVEDIEVNREIVISILEDTGVKIVSATNGLEALEIFTEDPSLFDAILMDLQMPVLDGLGATKQIRAMRDTPAAKSVPIIAMTANAFKEDALKCLEAGMNEHIAKPFDAIDLIKKLAVWLDA